MRLNVLDRWKDTWFRAYQVKPYTHCTSVVIDRQSHSCYIQLLIKHTHDLTNNSHCTRTQIAISPTD